MNNLILILSLLLNYSVLFCQTDNLEPIDQSLIFYNQPVLREYYLNINDILLKNLTQNSIARIIVIPSFFNEYVLSIEMKSDGIYLLKRTVSRPIWNNNNISTIKTIDKEIKVSSDFAKELNHLFYTVLKHTQYPREHIIGADGITYYYSAYKDFEGIKTGKTWSPSKGTRMFELVEITDLINEMIEKNNSDLTGLILEKSNLLIEKFEK